MFLMVAQLHVQIGATLVLKICHKSKAKQNPTTKYDF
jgi:hypothetical protein